MNEAKDESEAEHRSVLIVDDNVDLADNLREILEDEGVSCDVAESGDAALEMMNRRTYDLVLTDLRMDGTDGMGVLREVSQRWPRTPVIIMTAYARDGTVERARREGALDVIPKPIDVEALVGTVERMLATQRRVLLVEDDEDQLENLRELLSGLPGVGVVTAKTFEEARRRIQDAEFDVAVIDFRLPDGDGLVLGRQLLEERGSRCPTLVFISAYTDAIAIAVRDLAAATPKVLSKPFSPAMLLSIVRKTA